MQKACNHSSMSKNLTAIWGKLWHPRIIKFYSFISMYLFVLNSIYVHLISISEIGPNHCEICPGGHLNYQCGHRMGFTPHDEYISPIGVTDIQWWPCHCNHPDPIHSFTQSGSYLNRYRQSLTTTVIRINTRELIISNLQVHVGYCRV